MEEQIGNTLSEVVKALKRGYKPLRIILFGSHAYGSPTEDSDIDLLIVKNTKRRRGDRIVIVKRLLYDPNRKIPISPLVYTPSELEERLKLGDNFIQEVLQKGIILYEKSNS